MELTNQSQSRFHHMCNIHNNTRFYKSGLEPQNLVGQVELLQSRADLMNAHAECVKDTQLYMLTNIRGSE